MSHTKESVASFVKSLGINTFGAKHMINKQAPTALFPQETLSSAVVASFQSDIWLFFVTNMRILGLSKGGAFSGEKQLDVPLRRVQAINAKSGSSMLAGSVEIVTSEEKYQLKNIKGSEPDHFENAVRMALLSPTESQQTTHSHTPSPQSGVITSPTAPNQSHKTTSKPAQAAAATPNANQPSGAFNVFAWVFGLLHVLMSISSLMQGGVGAFACFALAAFISLPPLYRLLDSKLSITPTTRAILSTILVFAGSAFLPQTDNPTSQQSTPSKKTYISPSVYSSTDKKDFPKLYRKIKPRWKEVDALRAAAAKKVAETPNVMVLNCPKYQAKAPENNCVFLSIAPMASDLH